MKFGQQLVALMIMMLCLCISCSGNLQALNSSDEGESIEKSEMNQSIIIDAVWDQLEPNTSSHDRSNWQVVEILFVTGEQVFERFEGDPASGCWSGPKPVENRSINFKANYWFVFMTPKPATPAPFNDTPSPTAPPLIPEPF
ncbi:MAG: hypothetical protein ABFS17_12345, partial [Chloroflexota bacterium]